MDNSNDNDKNNNNDDNNNDYNNNVDAECIVCVSWDPFEIHN